ncbi:MAG: GNAT family N-acetyltransferase [Bacteroidota bacterium]
MTQITRTTPTNTDFRTLVEKLDAYLAITDGGEHDFYDQYNQLDDIEHVIVAFDGNRAVGCGAIKVYGDHRIEVKRMWVNEDQRGRGVAMTILKELELWAAELGATSCILETGKRQKEAVCFYKKAGYREIAKYGQYAEMDNSICFMKELY